MYGDSEGRDTLPVIRGVGRSLASMRPARGTEPERGAGL
jgi:hypothetical protein